MVINVISTAVCVLECELPDSKGGLDKTIQSDHNLSFIIMCTKNINKCHMLPMKLFY